MILSRKLKVLEKFHKKGSFAQWGNYLVENFSPKKSRIRLNETEKGEKFSLNFSGPCDFPPGFQFAVLQNNQILYFEVFLFYI